MTRNKHRKKSGWTYPDSVLKIPKKEIIEEGLEPEAFWDDWNDSRDGTRGYDDRTKIRSKWMMFAEFFNVKRWNKKLKKLLLRRKWKKRRRIF